MRSWLLACSAACVAAALAGASPLQEVLLPGTQVGGVSNIRLLVPLVVDDNYDKHHSGEAGHVHAASAAMPPDSRSHPDYSYEYEYEYGDRHARDSPPRGSYRDLLSIIKEQLHDGDGTSSPRGNYADLLSAITQQLQASGDAGGLSSVHDRASLHAWVRQHAHAHAQAGSQHAHAHAESPRTRLHHTPDVVLNEINEKLNRKLANKLLHHDDNLDSEELVLYSKLPRDRSPEAAWKQINDKLMRLVLPKKTNDKLKSRTYRTDDLKDFIDTIGDRVRGRDLPDANWDVTLDGELQSTRLEPASIFNHLHSSNEKPMKFQERVGRDELADSIHQKLHDTDNLKEWLQKLDDKLRYTDDPDSVLYAFDGQHSPRGHAQPESGAADIAVAANPDVWVDGPYSNIPPEEFHLDSTEFHPRSVKKDLSASQAEVMSLQSLCGSEPGRFDTSEGCGFCCAISQILGELETPAPAPPPAAGRPPVTRTPLHIDAIFPALGPESHHIDNFRAPAAGSDPVPDSHSAEAEHDVIPIVVAVLPPPPPARGARAGRRDWQVLAPPGRGPEVDK